MCFASQAEIGTADPLSLLLNLLLGWFFKLFNVAFQAMSNAYGAIVGWALRLSFLVMLVYGACCSYFTQHDPRSDRLHPGTG